MATITGTSDQKQWLNRTTFQIGDTVRIVGGTYAGQVGKIITPQGVLHQSTPAPPTTSYVDVLLANSPIVATELLTNLSRA